MAFRFQFRLRTLLLLTAILAALLGVGTWVYHNWDEYHIATLDCENGRTIIITAATSWEISQPVYYRVVANGKTVAPPTSFMGASGGNAGRLRFDLVKAENGNLIGVVNASPGSDGELLILHDFATGESWPRLRGNEVSYFPAVQRKWQDYFDRLQRENPTLPRSDYFRH